VHLWAQNKKPAVRYLILIFINTYMMSQYTAFLLSQHRAKPASAGPSHENCDSRQEKKETRLYSILPSSGLLSGVRRLETDVSGLPIGPIFKGRLLKIGPIGSPETSVSNHITQRNNPEDGVIHFNGGGSLLSHSVRSQQHVG
jgi:hypothetical protein